jgi:hypothetical protein
MSAPTTQMQQVRGTPMLQAHLLVVQVLLQDLALPAA